MSFGVNPMTQVAQVLSETLSVNNSTRNNAENEIKKLSASQGLAVTLLQLVQNDQVSPEIRMAASLALKNFVRENWSGDGEAPLLENERDEIRNAVLTSMFDIPTSYRRQMSQTVCLIGRYDFPEKWPRLIEVLGDYLNAGTDFDKLVTALSTLEELVKRYRHEMRSDKLWKEILLVLQKVAEPITQLYSKMLQYAPVEGVADTMTYGDRISWLEIVLLSSKIYHSLVSQDLPEYFEDNLTPWMNGFQNLLKMKLPSVDEYSDDSEANSLDKLKCVICEVVTLFSQRFEDCFAEYTQPFIGAIWQLLVETDSRVRFDGLVNASFGFLSAIAQRQQYAVHFQGDGVLQAICENVIIKHLLLRTEDVEMYKNEPFEFLKRDIEGSDLETRRRGATDFVRALCKQFEAEVFQILSGAITAFLADYQINPVENFVKKDVVYFLVSAMASKTTTAKYGATSTSQLINVSDFYEQHVRGDLLEGGSNDIPILRSDALKYLVLFRNQLKAEFITECFCGKNNQQGSSIIRLLGSDHVLLHHYVAYAVERLLLIRNANGQLLTSENVPIGLLIEALFGCFSDQNSYQTHYIMKALMRCFNIIDNESATNAHIFVGRLEQMIVQAIQNPVNPQFVHFVFESLCVLIRMAYTKVAGGLDKHVIRIIELIIPKDIVDFVPYALQITALLLDQSQAERLRGQPVSQEQYLGFFPYLLKGDFWSRSANIPALMLVFESFITSFPQIVFGPEYIDQVLGCFQRLIGSKAHDQHGFKLANSMLNYIDTYEKLSSRNLLLPMLNRMQQLKTPKYARQLVFFLCRFAAVKGGGALANALESIQPGIFMMVMEKIIIAELKAMPQATSYEEKRIVIIGVAAIIQDTFNALGQLYGHLVENAVGILEAHNHRKLSQGAGDAPSEIQNEADDQYAEMTELEYSDPYCKLSYAQHTDTVGKEVINIKAHLGRTVLFNIGETNPQSIACLSAKVQNDLRVYVSSG